MEDDRPLSILHMCLSSGWGGLEMYAPRVAPHLRARGHEVAFAARPDSATADAMARAGGALLLVSPGPLRLFGIPVVSRFVRERGVQILHCHKSSDLRCAAMVAHLTGVRLVFTEHMGVRRPKRDPYHRWVYGRVDRVLSINEEVRRRNVEALPLPPERIFALPYGVDLDRYAPVLDAEGKAALRRDLGLPRDGTIVGLPGRVSRPKGQEEFIEAAALLRRRFPGVVFLVIGGLAPEEGADPGYPDELRARVARLGLEGSVRFTGYRSDVPRILELLTVACVPSHDEAFGMVVIEAMAAGVPVIGTRRGGIPELVAEGDDGLLVEPRDPALLAGAIGDLLGDPARAQRMGRRGREKARERFSQRVHVDRLLSHYRAVLR